MNRENLPEKRRILTGHRPTGPRHIGHLVGTFDNWVRLQDAYECFFLIADLHVLTTDYEHPENIQENILEVLATGWLPVSILSVRHWCCNRRSRPMPSSHCCSACW